MGSTITLTPAQLDKVRHSEYFPNAEQTLKEYLYLGVVNNVDTAWVLFQSISDTSVCIHLYVMPECRVPSIFKRIKAEVPGLFQKFMEEENIQTIVAVCDHNNTASMKFQKLMGFNPQPYWMGAQHRR